MDNKKLALGALFALLLASKNKISEKVEKKKEEIAKEQWTKKNKTTLLSMQELEQRIKDEEKTIDAQINADNKKISLSEYSVFGRFPSDSEGVSYLESTYILPYIDSKRNLYVREFSLSYFKDIFLFDNIEEMHFLIDDNKGEYLLHTYYWKFYFGNMLKKDIVVPTKIDEYGFFKEDKSFQILQTILPKTYISEEFELGKNEYIPQSFGFITDFKDDIGIFLFIPLNFWVPPMEKGRKFTFEKFFIKNISIKTNLNNGYYEELNKSLQILNLYNNEFTSEEILNKKKNQLDVLNFISKKYVEPGVNYFYIPLMLYFPKYNFKVGEWIDIIKNKDISVSEVFEKASGIYGSIEDLTPKKEIFLQYFFNGLTFINQISFDIEYKFLETLTNNVHLICNYDSNENTTDVSNISKREIITNSELIPKLEYKYGQTNINQNVNIGILKKLGFWEQYQDEIIENYLSYFSEKFYGWLNKNVLFRPEYGPNDEKNIYYQETKKFN